jgi:hypothetical protein
MPTGLDMRRSVRISDRVRQLVIRVHSGVKTSKKIFLGVAHMVKNYIYTKKMEITRDPVHPLV